MDTVLTKLVSWWILRKFVSWWGLTKFVSCGYSLGLFSGECHNHTACFLVSTVLTKLVSW